MLSLQWRSMDSYTPRLFHCHAMDLVWLAMLSVYLAAYIYQRGIGGV